MSYRAGHHSVVRRTTLDLAGYVPPCRLWLADGGPNIWFEVAAGGGAVERQKENDRTAKAICFSCSLMEECREQGRREREYGIWGGETETERARAGYAPPGLQRLRRKLCRSAAEAAGVVEAAS